MIFKKSIVYSTFLLSFSVVQGMDIESADSKAFEELKWSLESAYWALPKREATFAQRRNYGYNGMLIPIVKKPEGIRGGFIIKGAQPSLYYGFWYADSCQKENYIFIEEDNLKYKAKIINSEQNIPKILSSCLVSTGTSTATMDKTMAILWEVKYQYKSDSLQGNYYARPIKKQLYISLACLAQVQKRNNIFDLDGDKREISLTRHDWQPID